MTAAYELAGYAVATLALGRSIPDKVVLKEDTEYDLGRCTEPELDTIWAVGHMAGERSRNDGCSGEQGLIVINVRMESSIADGMELNPGAEVILDENWDTIVRVARLLIERGILSKSELEGEVFEPNEAITLSELYVPEKQHRNDFAFAANNTQNPIASWHYSTGGSAMWLVWYVATIGTLSALSLLPSLAPMKANEDWTPDEPTSW